MDVPLTLLISLSFTIALVVTGFVRNFALEQALVDLPNERSSHTIPTPRGGGIGFILAFFTVLLATNWWNPFDFSPQLFLVINLLPLAVVGFLDDRYNLPSLARYLVQLSVAILAVIHYGSFSQPWLESWGLAGFLLGAILTVIAFTALINFYNFMDGLDGFITTVTILQLGFIVFYLHQPLWLLLIAGLGGFLYWNWSPAKIFMGDVGSTVLGAVVAIALLQVPDVTIAWSSLAITLPITADTTYTIFFRLRRGENIFQAHRCHIFQRLQQSGWSHAQVTLTYGFLTLVIAVLITVWGSYGAIASVLLTLVSLSSAEFYLRRRCKASSLLPLN